MVKNTKSLVTHYKMVNEIEAHGVTKLPSGGETKCIERTNNPVDESSQNVLKERHADADNRYYYLSFLMIIITYKP